MAVKILHIADVHLDRPFVGLSLDAARARRRELREVLERCLALAEERAVDVVTIGGDLWEDEHVTPDTCRWVADRLAGVAIPVVLVTGNHDPLRPGGPYLRTRWPDNVFVLPAGPDLHRHDVGALSIWGMSWGATPLTAQALDTFSVPTDGMNVLLLHGTVASAAFEDNSHCRFTAAAVRSCGFALCLAGHLHAGGVRDELVVYPGSPEPLGWDESGRHTAAIVDFASGAPAHVELVEVNHRTYSQTSVDCDGANSSADVERALRDAIGQAMAQYGPDGLCLRALLRGRVDPACQIDMQALAAAGPELTLLELRDETKPAFDLDALAGQPTSTGTFVRDLRGRIEECSDQERPQLELALELGLGAMHGDHLADAG